MKNNIKTAVITGAACSGKTTVIRRLSRQLADDGVAVFTQQETATELLESGFSATLNKALFQRSLFDFQLSKERIYREYIASFTKERAVLLLDRSPLDGAIYSRSEDYADIMFRYGLTEQSILARYDAVIQLQPSVFVADYVRTDNNEYRQESSAEECKVQDQMLRALYRSHGNYHYVQAEPAFDDKYRRVLSIVKGLVGE